MCTQMANHKVYRSREQLTCSVNMIKCVNPLHYSLLALTFDLATGSAQLFFGSQKLYGLKTTTVGTAMRIEAKRHFNRPNPTLYDKVIFAVGKKRRQGST